MTLEERELFVLLFTARTCAKQVVDKLKSTAGGDAFEYKGSMNAVEDLREAIHLVDSFIMENDIKRPDDEGEDEDGE